MRPALAILLVATVLGGCNSQPAEPTVREQEAELVNSTADLKQWDRVFGVPSDTVAALNQFGFRLADYGQAGEGAATRGEPIILSQSDRPAPNEGTVEVSGATTARIDRIDFTLALTDPDYADTAKGRFAKVIGDFLFQFDLEPGDALAAVAGEADAETRIAGTPVRIDTTEGEDGVRRITVTFTRPDAKAPDNQPDQGQADGNRA
ncbi:hypothetical protein GO308_01600 [Sphingomonas sp. SFZ2018-12]|uniref:hypothetical protein n=1 Tax=Sphingomonas sp. SFZ2018-12 TaxID=2683197 RepID=UPI001F11801D|nr:hypothetical protein [Sphingomonas sp. SFZ2018-12]MCH4891802.1 hypothetical protein [Sphingomonas sp. SFZ2018-12]